MKNEHVGESVVTPDLTHTALGVYKDEETGKWQIAKMKFNPETGSVGEFERIISDEGSKEAVIYKFKIQAAMDVLK